MHFNLAKGLIYPNETIKEKLVYLSLCLSQYTKFTVKLIRKAQKWYLLYLIVHTRSTWIPRSAR